jgi:hypothetical protein
MEEKNDKVEGRREENDEEEKKRRKAMIKKRHNFCHLHVYLGARGSVVG